MREIGKIQSETQAKQFSDFLLVEGIENQIEEEDGEWIVWIISEDKLEKAKQLFSQYLENPNRIDHQSVTRKAEKIREEEEKTAAAYRKLMQKSRVKFRATSGVGEITRAMIIISVVVFILMSLGLNQIVSYFYISLSPGLREVFHGQIWRLVTPIFLHFGFLHILFNMFWLYYLGSQIENVHGVKVFLLLVLSIAIIPNVCQFFVSGPYFGGMSGVNYGLLGYIWIRSKFDPLSGVAIENYLVIWMLLWFFLGLTGMVGNVANTVHGVGLAVGMGWGYILAEWSRLNR